MHLQSLLRLAPGVLALLSSLGTLSLGAVSLAAPAIATPVQGETQRVTIKTEDKLALVGTFYAPKDAKVRAPGVVLVHGPGGSRAELDGLAARLQKAGFAALTLDLRGHGESATDALRWNTLEAEAKTRTWAFMTRDVKAGIDFLLDQKGVHATTVSLAGYAAGCSLVARQATRDERVRDLVLLAPQTEELGTSLAQDLVELSGLPVFVVFSKDESTTAKRFADAAQRAATGGEPTLETQVTKLPIGELLADAKLAAELGRWMRSKALPTAAGRPAH